MIANGVRHMSHLNRLSASSAARKLAAREITAEALLADCLERIAEREPDVHAWTFLDTDAALRRARALDAQGTTGLLHGLPIAVKDLFDTFDMPSSYGSPIYADHRPAWDAACVAVAKAAGTIVVGKTVTTEFATFHPGPTRNPRNLQHTPGGSSSGSAAAVADWMVPLAFGTQTAGSIVRPAAVCGAGGGADDHHGVRGREVAGVRESNASRAAERGHDQDDRRGSCRVAAAIRRRAVPGSDLSRDAAGGLQRIRRAARAQHRRRGAHGDRRHRRSAVQPDMDAVARARRARARRSWAARIAL